MRLAILMAALAALSYAQDKPKPTAATPAEVSGFAVKQLEQLSAEIEFQKAEIQGLKAQITKYEELLAAGAASANKDVQSMLAEMQKKHNAAGCNLNVSGEWTCPEPRK